VCGCWQLLVERGRRGADHRYVVASAHGREKGGREQLMLRILMLTNFSHLPNKGLTKRFYRYLDLGD
jgi:hypothetical protein